LADLSFGDKLLHFGAYAATTGTFLLAAVWRPGRGPGGFPRSAPLIVGAAIVLSGLIELAQGAFTSRTADAWDAVASILGAAVAWAAWRVVARVRTSVT
jgi:VanZ family protein